MNNNSLIAINSNIQNETEHLIVFNIDSNQYAVNIKNVLEVINIPEIEIPSQTPKGIIGMFNYNEVMTSVIDICPFLGISTNKFSLNDKMIIVVYNENCFALRTGENINIISINPENLQSLPYSNEKSILKEIYRLNENTVNIIDIDSLNKLITEDNKEENTINYASLFPNDEKSKNVLKLRAISRINQKEIFSFPVNINFENQHLLFTIDKHNYYLDLKYIKECISIKRLNITKLPYTQNYIKGIINSKGDFLVVIDLKCFLNNEENNSNENSKLIITEGKNFNIAFLVDDIKYIRNLKNIGKDIMYSGNCKYISAEFTEDNELYSILNYEKIINDERIYIDIN